MTMFEGTSAGELGSLLTLSMSLHEKVVRATAPIVIYLSILFIDSSSVIRI